MRSVFLLVIEASTTTGQCSLMRSGDRTRARRVPPCSDPSTGSRRTRTTSPLRGLLFKVMLHFLFKRMEFRFHGEVDFVHIATAGNDLSAQLIALPRLEPVLH